MIIFGFGAVHAKNSEESASVVQKTQTEHLVVLRSIDKKYQKADSIVMAVSKKDKIAALEQVREFEGALTLQKGKFRMAVVSKDKNKDESLIVADGKTIWFVTPPPKEFKDAKIQVLKAPMNTDRAKSQGLLQMLTEGGVLKYFTVLSSVEKGLQIVYELKPDKSSVEFRKAELTVDKEKQVLLALKHWDSMDNETEYVFSAIEFDKQIDKKLLSYTPPKNAEVVNYK